MEYYSSKEIAPGVIRITDCSVTCMYLVIGEEKAAVLDTGVGCGNLLDYIRTLTDRPLICLISHGHVDHAMGAGVFDTAYMSHEDAYVYEEHKKIAFRKQYARLFQITRGLRGVGFLLGHPEWEQTREMDAFEELHIGDTFDLGGEIIEVCPGKGHTKGNVTFLLQNHRLLMTGDACNTNVFLYDWYSASVEEYLEAMKQLKERVDGRYDKILLCHGNDASLTQQPGLIEGAIWLCEAIMDGRDKRIHTRQFGGVTAYSTKKPGKPEEDIGDHSLCSILYNIDRIRKQDSPEQQ